MLCEKTDVINVHHLPSTKEFQLTRKFLTMNSGPRNDPRTQRIKINIFIFIILKTTLGLELIEGIIIRRT